MTSFIASFISGSVSLPRDFNFLKTLPNLSESPSNAILLVLSLFSRFARLTTLSFVLKKIAILLGFQSSHCFQCYLF
ncbi:hypothetical protein FACS1894132_11820 [Clostridia bacterium]|nr:hypothetical protein FACS1894132_11820 [Clostridia bacterium]